MKTTPEAWPILGRHSTSMLIGGSRPSFSGSPKKPSKDLTGSYITRPKQTKMPPKHAGIFLLLQRSSILGKTDLMDRILGFLKANPKLLLENEEERLPRRRIQDSRSS